MSKLFKQVGTNKFMITESVDSHEKDKADLISVGCKLTDEDIHNGQKWAHFVIPTHDGANTYHSFTLNNGIVDFHSDRSDKVYKVSDYVHAIKHGMSPEEMGAESQEIKRNERDYN